MTEDVAGAMAVAPASDADRLAGLFDAHHARLYKLARRMVENADEARDLVQDTFLRAACAAGRIPQGAEEAWLVRVLVNACRDRWRRAGTERRYQAAHPAAAERADGEAVLVARDIVWRALRTLPARRRTIVILHELEDASVADIAALLGISTITVRWHLGRGRREIAQVVRKVRP